MLKRSERCLGICFEDYTKDPLDMHDHDDDGGCLHESTPGIVDARSPSKTGFVDIFPS